MKKFTVRPSVPPGRSIHLGESGGDGDWVWVGRLAEAGPLTNIRMDVSAEHVVAIVGKRGSGKSYTLGSLLEGLTTEPGGSSIGSHSGRKAVLLFDTLGIYQWSDQTLSETSTSELVRQQYSIRSGWNIPTTQTLANIWRTGEDDNIPKSHRLLQLRYCDLDAADWGYLLGLDIVQDRMGQLLLDAYEKVVSDGWEDGGIHHPPNPEYTLEHLIDCIRSDQELLDGYQRETRRGVMQQLGSYSRNPVFSSQGTLLADVLIPGRLNVIVMNTLPDQLRLVLITALVRQIIRSRITASQLEKDLMIREDLTDSDRESVRTAIANELPPCWVTADEAQNFLPAERHTAATDMLLKLVREGRNYGISFAITTQQPTAIDPRIMAQVDTLIAHKVTVQADVEYVRRNLKSPFPESVKYSNQELGFDSLLRQLDVGQALISNTESDRAYIADIRPRVSVHGGF